MAHTQDHREVIAKLLLDISASGEFAVGGELRDCPLNVCVHGLGDIVLPLTPTAAVKLSQLCQQAPFGRGAQTLYDTNVRNTKQLDPAQFKVTTPGWPTRLQSLVDQACSDLGSGAASVEAQLYKLLLYEPNSFFVPHRDTEKAPGMFATLAITLPSPHTGGQLVVKHKHKKLVFDTSQGADTSASTLQFAAFYADCQHEVMPLDTGYRLVLIYNLCYKGSVAPPALAPRQVSPSSRRLVQALREWDEDEEGPIKLVYVLEHTYTEAAMRDGIECLKNGDRAVADLLLAALQAGAPVELHLAGLAKRAVGGLCGDLSDYDRSRWDMEEDEDEDEDGEGHRPERYEMDPVSYEDIPTLDIWAKLGGEGAGPVYELPRLGVDMEEEVVQDPEGMFSDSDKDEDEVIEATGNEGATLDRWYTRAALVMWPHSRDLRIRLAPTLEAAIAQLDAYMTKWKNAHSTSSPPQQPLPPQQPPLPSLPPSHGRPTKAQRTGPSHTHAAASAPPSAAPDSGDIRQLLLAVLEHLSSGATGKLSSIPPTQRPLRIVPIAEYDADEDEEDSQGSQDPERVRPLAVFRHGPVLEAVRALGDVRLLKRLMARGMAKLAPEQVAEAAEDVAAACLALGWENVEADFRCLVVGVAVQDARLDVGFALLGAVAVASQHQAPAGQEASQPGTSTSTHVASASNLQEPPVGQEASQPGTSSTTQVASASNDQQPFGQQEPGTSSTTHPAPASNLQTPTGQEGLQPGTPTTTHTALPPPASEPREPMDIAPAPGSIAQPQASTQQQAAGAAAGGDGASTSQAPGAAQPTGPSAVWSTTVRNLAETLVGHLSSLDLESKPCFEVWDADSDESAGDVLTPVTSACVSALVRLGYDDLLQRAVRTLLHRLPENCSLLPAVMQVADRLGAWPALSLQPFRTLVQHTVPDRASIHLVGAFDCLATLAAGLPTSPPDSDSPVAKAATHACDHLAHALLPLLKDGSCTQVHKGGLYWHNPGRDKPRRNEWREHEQEHGPVLAVQVVLAMHRAFSSPAMHRHLQAAIRNVSGNVALRGGLLPAVRQLLQDPAVQPADLDPAAGPLWRLLRCAVHQQLPEDVPGCLGVLTELAARLPGPVGGESSSAQAAAPEGATVQVSDETLQAAAGLAEELVQQFCSARAVPGLPPYKPPSLPPAIPPRHRSGASWKVAVQLAEMDRAAKLSVLRALSPTALTFTKQLFTTLSRLGCHAALKRAASHICRLRETLPAEAVLVPAVQAISAQQGEVGRDVLRLLLESCMKQLEDIVASTPAQAPTNWAQPAIKPCSASCLACQKLSQFLTDPARTTWERTGTIAMIEDVEARLREVDADVSTEHMGNKAPYSVVVTKTRKHYEHAKERGRQAQLKMAQLRALLAAEQPPAGPADSHAAAEDPAAVGTLQAGSRGSKRLKKEH